MATGNLTAEKEEGCRLQLDFTKLDTVTGCIPVAVQHADTNEVILVAYTNEAAMRRSFAERRLVLYSSSRKEIWEKGATSGCRFELVEAFVNCEQNSLLYRVRPWPAGRTHGICHTHDAKGESRQTCFYRKINLDTLLLVHVES